MPNAPPDAAHAVLAIARVLSRHAYQQCLSREAFSHMHARHHDEWYSLEAIIAIVDAVSAGAGGRKAVTYSRVDPAEERKAHGWARDGHARECEGDDDGGEHHEHAVCRGSERGQESSVCRGRRGARTGTMLKCESALGDESAPSILWVNFSTSDGAERGK